MAKIYICGGRECVAPVLALRKMIHIQWNMSYSLEQKQYYCVSNHFFWFDSFHICFVDLEAGKFNTVWRYGRGTVLWVGRQIYNFMHSTTGTSTGVLDSTGICLWAGPLRVTCLIRSTAGQLRWAVGLL